MIHILIQIKKKILIKTYTKTHWSLFDYLMMSIMIANTTPGIGIGFGIGFQPISIKLSGQGQESLKVYLNKENSVKFASSDGLAFVPATET